MYLEHPKSMVHRLPYLKDRRFLHAHHNHPVSPPTPLHPVGRSVVGGSRVVPPESVYPSQHKRVSGTVLPRKGC